MAREEKVTAGSLTTPLRIRPGALSPRRQGAQGWDDGRTFSPLRLCPLGKDILKFSVVLAGWLFWITGDLASAQRNGAEFLLFPRPDRLVLLNAFQQTPSREERSILLPFTPMHVVKADLLLPDGYTRCTQVEAFGKMFFVLKNQDGSFLGTEQSAPPARLNGAVAANDTIRTSEQLVVQSPDGRSQQTIKKGEIVVIRLRHKRDIFVQTGGRLPAYGWVINGVVAPGGTRAHPDGTAQASNRALESVLPRVKARVDEINSVLSGLFTEFNRSTGGQRTTPSWEISMDDSGITCQLRSTPYAGAFSKSTELLARDIQNMLLGTTATVASDAGRITIRDTGN
jgi:hypothetical protein